MVLYMRKVIFCIDDLKYLDNLMIAENIDQEERKNILMGLDSFKAIYTLYGTNNSPDRYTLTDVDGKKILLCNLNGYQKGVILNDCMSYFCGGSYHENGEGPFGVVNIQELTA
jgi:energy-converting hydrogenase A subunit M